MTERPGPEITYPCVWSYRIVGTDESEIRDAVATIIGAAPHTLTPVRRSRTGRYCSLNLELTVEDEPQRQSIYAALQDHAAVHFVL